MGDSISKHADNVTNNQHPVPKKFRIIGTCSDEWGWPRALFRNDEGLLDYLSINKVPVAEDVLELVGSCIECDTRGGNCKGYTNLRIVRC